MSLALVLLALLTFAPVRAFDFVHYDDFEFVVENPHIAGGLTAENIRWAWRNPYAAAGGPLTWLSHMLDVELFGLQPGGHHVTNLVLHVLSVLTLLAVLRAMTGSLWRSAFVAALFAVHPLHVESVAWVAERKDVLSGLFAFLAIGAYVGYVRQPGLARYVTVAAVLALGLLSKPMVATLPFVFLLLDVWPLERLAPDRRSLQRVPRLLLEKVPLILMAMVALLMTVRSQHEIGAVSDVAVIPMGLRIANATVSYVAYLGKVVWPVGLVPYYPFRLAVPPTTLVVCGALLLTVTLAAVAIARRAPFVAVGWFWYLGMLVPVIGLVQVGGHAMADRFTYLPLVGIFIVLAWGAPAVASRLKIPRAPAAMTAAILIVACAVTARAQVLHWSDSIELWQHTVRVDPANARALSNLGVALAFRNRQQEAIGAYEEAIRLQPAVAKTHHNLGLAYAAVGQRQAAVARFTEAIRLDPDYAKPRMQLANLLAEAGETASAIDQYREAMRLEPADPLIRVNLAVTLGRLGRPAEAVPHMLEAIRLDPGNARWHYLAGLMMIEAGRRGDGVGHLETALRLDPGFEEARRALASIGVR